jgi:hypothetical protein
MRNIKQLIELAENKIKSLTSLRDFYFKTGDVENLEKYDLEIEETKQTLEKLKTLN